MVAAVVEVVIPTESLGVALVVVGIPSFFVVVEAGTVDVTGRRFSG